MPQNAITTYHFIIFAKKIKYKQLIYNLMNNNNSKPSFVGVRKTGLETKKRVEPTAAQPEKQITTQNPQKPTPSGRAYA